MRTQKDALALSGQAQAGIDWDIQSLSPKSAHKAHEGLPEPTKLGPVGFLRTFGEEEMSQFGECKYVFLWT